MKRDHDLIAWAIFGALAMLLGVLMIGAAVAPVAGIVLMLVGIGVALGGVLRHRRT